MTDPTGNRPSSSPEQSGSSGQADRPLQPEDFAPRRRSLHAVKLVERAPRPEAPRESPAPRGAVLKIFAVIGGLLTLWMVSTFSAREETAARLPARAASQRPVTLGAPAGIPERPPHPPARPVYRRLSDEELKAQIEPGTSITE